MAVGLCLGLDRGDRVLRHLLALLHGAGACGYADATVVVPMDFLRVPLTAAAGWLLYAERIDLYTVLGAALILAGNLLNLRSVPRRPPGPRRRLNRSGQPGRLAQRRVDPVLPARAAVLEMLQHVLIDPQRHQLLDPRRVRSAATPALRPAWWWPS